ncbi:MAG TPA: urease accessory protein UreD [Burkholderiaceae bacterium]|jgi:urease accessory protein
MSWIGTLDLDYRIDGRGGTTALDRHEGPLRVLQRLYPEGPRVCHHVLVHPPGGIVGGDQLSVQARLAEGTHALITTPGATRFYRSAGELAVQQLHARLEPGSRLEWLPLEAIAYDGALAENRMDFELAPGAEMMAWDVLALGLPAAGQGFARGRFLQQLELPGRWLERGHIDAADAALLNSPLGLAGHRVLATFCFAAGEPLLAKRREHLLEATRELLELDSLRATAGCTSPEPGVIVLRVLAPRVEPAMDLLKRVRAVWREQAWHMAPMAPRVWST